MKIINVTLHVKPELASDYQQFISQLVADRVLKPVTSAMTTSKASLIPTNTRSSNTGRMPKQWHHITKPPTSSSFWLESIPS